MDIFELRNLARLQDLRNRNIGPDENVPATVQIPVDRVRGWDLCINPFCDSILVLGDGQRCRQCVLQDRWVQ